MTFNYNKLRGLIKEKGFTESDVAKAIGMTQWTFSRKLNGLTFFDTNEIKKMIDLLNVDENNIHNVFFTQN